MDEFDLIRRYFAPIATSPGADDLRDDVAEIAPGLIATKDAIVEGIHFLPDDPLDTVAQKLVRASISDIVAKGGKPEAALLALIWPKGRPHEQLEDFARGLGKDLQYWGAHLVGGDTTSTNGPLTLSLTLLGKVGARGPVRRSGAKPGEDVWVTGDIGDSWLGLQAATVALGKLTAEVQTQLVARYRVPEPPRLSFADLISARVSSSIDVSDGLVADAGHIARASSVRLLIGASLVPLSALASHYISNGMANLRDMLTGGDDYQTLFTAPQTARNAIRSNGTKLTRIGQVTEGEGVLVLDTNDEPLLFEATGWRHFRDPAQS